MFGNMFQRLLLKIALFIPGGYSIRPWLHRIRGVKIGNKVWISQMVYIDELHPENVEIGSNCSIGLRTSIFTHFYWGHKRKDNPSKVIIEKDVFIGPHCVILPSVRIGEGAVIKAGTVINTNIPPFTFWGYPNGQPLAKVSVPLTPDHTYEAFIKGLKLIRQRKGND